eukprot:366473-Chlamydomonas_euryale.AAC.2
MPLPHKPLSCAGGGNVLNVQRTVKQLISSGAKGCFIEDQDWPKRQGQLRTKSVIPMEEASGKRGGPGCGEERRRSFIEDQD